MTRGASHRGAARPGRAADDGGIAAFGDLIAPISRARFFADHWETAPLHIRRSDGRYYRRLLTRDVVESAISSGGLRFPAIQLAKGGAFLPADAFTHSVRSGGDVFAGVPDLDRIAAEFRAGATISLPAFHRACRPLGDLAAAIEAEFDHPVHTNVYVTPGNAAGFSPHYDTHEVFVLQVSGSKRWTIHDPPLTLPHRHQPFDPRSYTLSAPSLQVELLPGDLLYLPRGFVHATRTSEAASIHVTLGVTVYTWVEVLAELLQSSRDDVRFRRALPLGFAHRAELRQSLADAFAERLAELHRDVDPARLIETFAEKVKGGLSGAAPDFRSDVVAIGPDSRVRAPDSGDHRIEISGDRIALTFAGKTVRLPAHVRPILEEMRRRRSFCCRDLTSMTTQDAALTLIRHLHREGFLEPVP